MTSGVAYLFLFFGIVYSLANWVVLILVLAGYQRSTSFVPLLGGLLLAIGCGLMETLRPYALFVPLLDLGTLVFFWTLPKLIAEFWRYSQWNIVHKFSSASDGIVIDLVFYRHGIAEVGLKGCQSPSEAPIATGWCSSWRAEGDGYIIAASPCSGELRLRRSGDGLILTEVAETDTVANHLLLQSMPVQQTQ